jgi:hypothetical protein
VRFEFYLCQFKVTVCKAHKDGVESYNVLVRVKLRTCYPCPTEARFSSSNKTRICSNFPVISICLFVCSHGRPRQATDVLQPAGLLYRPLWTSQLWPPDAPAPTDAFRTLAAEVGTYVQGIRTVNLA